MKIQTRCNPEQRVTFWSGDLRREMTGIVSEIHIEVIAKKIEIYYVITADETIKSSRTHHIYEENIYPYMINNTASVSEAIALNPHVRTILKDHDFLGFDTLSGCVQAIIEHDDFGTRWEFITLVDQTIVAEWRTAVINKFINNNK